MAAMQASRSPPLARRESQPHQKGSAMRRYPAALTVIGILLIGLPWLLRSNPVVAWLASFGLMTLFVLVAGRAVTGQWLGALIDERNVVSLSRFQMALWTGLLLSAFFCAAMLNLAQGDSEALKIAVAPELWALMGISATSLVASPLILTTKAEKPPNEAEAQNSLVLLDRKEETPGNADHVGQLVVNRDIKNARWSDLFTGEEVGNATHLDLTRIQMFFFTIVTAVTYGGLVVQKFWTFGSDGINELPNLHASMVALLGISHTGYLAAKAVPHSRDANDPASMRPAAPAPDLLSDQPPLG
ncbi:hypothetical protein [Aquabacterium sp.]|uniref:hypothetical protein n=1 Tax=Aquabacterium sp. TaxID=1872578 RepID=UPI002D801081|nr:hypothetical protein [Aquabacterium sp.]